MPKKTVTKETTEFGEGDIQDPSTPGRSNGHGDEELDPVQMEKTEALRAKYQYAAKRNRMAIEELEKKDKEKEETKVDEIDDLIRTMTKQLKLKNVSKMLEDPDSRKGKEDNSFREDLREFAQYIDKKVDSIAGDKSTDRIMAMMMQQMEASRQAADRQMQMMMALLNRPDPNASMTQQLLMKTMDQKATVKDILPMMSQMQMMGMQQTADLEKTRMGIMQEIVVHALSAGEKDWDGMSIMEKADFVMGMMKKGVGFGVDKIKELKARKYEPGKEPKGLEKAKEVAKIGLGLADDNPAAPEAAGGAPATAAPGDPAAQPPVAGNPAPGQNGSPEGVDLKPIISDRVNKILHVVETEMRLGSDPFVIYEEIERLYFGLPEAMRKQIESDENPMRLVAAIEPYADKTILDRITKMALEDQSKADWLKAFHMALCGIEPEEDEDEDEDEDGGGDDDGDGDPSPETPPVEGQTA